MSIWWNGRSGITADQAGSLSLSASMRHEHSNKAVLDESTAAYTTAEKTKLGNLTDSFKGVYANQAAIVAAYPSSSAGWSAWNLGTATMWYVSSGTWTNSGVASIGNMLQSVYDPQSIGADAFARGNHTGTQLISTITNLNSASVDTSGNVSLPAELTVTGNVSGALVSSSGLSASAYGLYLSSAVPADTSYRLYNNNGTLMFNGNALAMGSSVSGTTNYLSKFTSSSSLGDSGIFEDSNGRCVFNNGVTISGTPSTDVLVVLGSYDDSVDGYIRLKGATIAEGNIYHDATYAARIDTSENLLPIRIDGSALILGMFGNVGIGTASPTYKLDVSGTIRSTDAATFASLSVGSLSGLLKASSGAVSIATAGTDYAKSLSAGTGISLSASSGVYTVALTAAAGNTGTFYNPHLTVDSYGRVTAAVSEQAYGICTETAATVAKTVSITGVTSLYVGLTIKVRFSYGNTANLPTLNVNGLGAVTIVDQTLQQPNALYPFMPGAGYIVEFTYAGGYWVYTNSVVQNYRSGTGWIQRYTNGWIRFGADSYISSSGQTVSFGPTMYDTNYAITVSPVGTTNSIGAYGSAMSVSTTGFTAWTADDSSFNAIWIRYVVEGFEAH